MNISFKAIAIIALLSLVSFPSDLRAADKIEASSMTNHAPSEAFSGFERFEMSKTTMAAPYGGQKANEIAQNNFQLNLDGRIQEWLAEKNIAAAKTDQPRVLLIEPRIEKVKFIGTGARFWAGAFAGSSRVLVKVKFTDKATGQVTTTHELDTRGS